MVLFYKGCDTYMVAWGGVTFTRILASPGSLFESLHTLPQLPDVLVIDLGTNDLCSEETSASWVVGDAMLLLEMLREH